MPRRARFVIPGVPLHIVHRGVNRATTFLDDGDFLRYLQYLEIATSSCRCALHAFTLMTNHVHLVLTPVDVGGPAAFMKQVAQGYSQYFNARRRRSGPLWEGRFHSSLIDSENYLLRCQRYAEMNAVRAGLVVRPEDYRWSSHRVNGYGEVSSLISPHLVYRGLDRNEADRQRYYRELFDARSTQAEDEEIRAAVCGGFPIGGSDFLRGVEARFGKQAVRRRAGVSRAHRQGELCGLSP